MSRQAGGPVSGEAGSESGRGGGTRRRRAWGGRRPEEAGRAVGRTAEVALAAIVAVAAVADVLVPGRAAAQITPNSAQEIQVSAAQTFQAAPVVASDAFGDFVVVWQRPEAGGAGEDILAQLYHPDPANGVAASGSPIQVNATTGVCQQFPAVAADAAGNFVVVWQRLVGGANGWDVYLRRFSSAGSPLAGEVLVNTTTAGNQERPAVAMAPDGRYLVVWQSDSQSGGQGWDVAAQAFTAAGAAVGGEVTVNANLAGAQHSPRAAFVAAPRAGFAIVWESGGGIVGRRFTPGGVAIDAAELPINSTTTGTQRNPAVAADPSGNYVVAWESVDANGLASRILARRFQGAAPIGNMSDVVVDATPGATAQHDPALATDTIGNWLVSWDSIGEDGSGAGIVAQQFDSRQTPQGAKVTLDNTITAGDQTLPSVAMSQGGNLLVAWQSLTPAGDAAVIEARPASLPSRRFYTLTPCRVVDTRGPNGPLGGPVLASGAARIFPLLSGACGIPATAKALALNITAVTASGYGFLTVYPGDAPFPGSSTLNFDPAHALGTLANNADVALSLDGQGNVAVVADVVGGNNTVHLIIDVNGYYQYP